MYLLRNFAFTENPNAQECGFQEECQQGFYGERCTENIANIARILRPVHTELKLLHDTCYHANGKVDQEQFAPELGHFMPGFVFGLVVASLHECYEPPQPQCQRDEQPVVDSVESKLQSRK